MKDLIKNNPELSSEVTQANKLYEGSVKAALINAKSHIEAFQNALIAWNGGGAQRGSDLFNLYKLKTYMKFIRAISSLDNTFLDVEAMHSALLQIEQDNRVLYVHKHAVFCLLDCFYDAMILGKILSDALGQTKKKVQRNRIYFYAKETYLLSRKDGFKSQGRLLKYDKNYVQFRSSIEALFVRRLAELGIATPDSAWNYLLTFTEGNNSKIEKLLLPHLMDYILLDKQIKFSTPNMGSSIKRNLLFELLKNVLKYRHFMSEPEIEKRDSGRKHAYEGSYYRYKDHAVADIFRGARKK